MWRGATRAARRPLRGYLEIRAMWPSRIKSPSSRSPGSELLLEHRAIMIEKLLPPAARGLRRVDMIVEEIESLLPRSETGTGEDEGLTAHIGRRRRKAVGDEAEGIDSGEIGAVDVPGEIRMARGRQ